MTDLANFGKDYLLPRVGRMDQLASIRRYVLDDGKGRGMRAFEVRDGSGLSFTVYPDRGLDIGPAEYMGLPLTWMTPNGPVAPAFYNDTGFEWLRTWCGGLMTTCGFMNAGPQCDTAQGHQGQHGRFDHIPAEEVNTRAYWSDDGRYVLEISGKIASTCVFFEKLVTTRTIRTWLGSGEIEVIDRTENVGFEELPLMQLYHMNFGWPLVDDSAELVCAEHMVVPQKDYSEETVAAWNRVSPPTPGISEEVYYHDLPADPCGMCDVTIRNPKRHLALKVSFRKNELPYFVHWKMNGQGDYVVGIEPANCFPEGLPEMEKKGILRRIAPGKTVETLIRVKVRDI